MKLPAPTNDANALQLAEWLELLALVRENGSSSEGDLRDVFEGVGYDPAQYDSEDDAEAEMEERIQSVAEELELRQKWSGRGYPFELVRGLITLRISYPLNLGHLAYAFSLLCSYVQLLPNQQRQAFPNIADLEKLFQPCGTLAAAGLISGNSVTFGYPRPDIPNFYKKLGEVGELLREGLPHSRFVEGASVSPNDAGVDVIAWRDAVDELPGRLYLLGQCGAGQHWAGKSPLSEYNSFHKLYWRRPPVSPVIGVTFTPFDLRMSVTKFGYQTYDEARYWKRWQLGEKHGIIVDRFRLAHYFQRGVTLHNRPFLRLWIEGFDQLLALRTWIDDAIAYLRN